MEEEEGGECNKLPLSFGGTVSILKISFIYLGKVQTHFQRSNAWPRWVRSLV